MPADLTARFIEEAQRMATTVDTVDIAGRRACRRASLPHCNTLCRCRRLHGKRCRNLQWAEAGLARRIPQAEDGDEVGITGCFCATAETGTLVLLSGPETYASAGLLPETHIAIVPASRIVSGHEEAFELIRSERGELPRAVNFVSGPSRTGDIEQTIVLGAHGPYRVHVIVVRGA